MTAFRDFCWLALAILVLVLLLVGAVDAINRMEAGHSDENTSPAAHADSA